MKSPWSGCIFPLNHKTKLINHAQNKILYCIKLILVPYPMPPVQYRISLCFSVNRVPAVLQKKMD